MTGPREVKCPRCKGWKEKFSRSYCNACQEKYGPNLKEMTEAAKEVLAERQRQKEKEGWSDAHDFEHDAGVLAQAGAAYAYAAFREPNLKIPVPFGWPWAKEWWKPKDPRRDLVRAAALIIAEIERLDNLEPVTSENQSESKKNQSLRAEGETQGARPSADGLRMELAKYLRDWMVADGASNYDPWDELGELGREAWAADADKIIAKLASPKEPQGPSEPTPHQFRDLTKLISSLEVMAKDDDPRGYMVSAAWVLGEIMGAAPQGRQADPADTLDSLVDGMTGLMGAEQAAFGRLHEKVDRTYSRGRQQGLKDAFNLIRSKYLAREQAMGIQGLTWTKEKPKV